MAGQILKAAVRLLATTIAAFSFLAAQPQGIAAFSGTIAGGDSDSAMTGTGPTSPQPAAKIPGSGNGPVAPTRGTTGTGGGTRAGTRTGGTTRDTTGDGTTGAGTTGTDGVGTTGGTTGDGTTDEGGAAVQATGDTTGDGTTGGGTTGTGADGTTGGDADTADLDTVDDEEDAVLGVETGPRDIAPAGVAPINEAELGMQQQGGAVAGAQQQGGAAAGLQSLPSTSIPTGSPLGALTALAGALYAITRRNRS